ncbi:S1 family peptidase [Amycolatopsis xylanica]|uniref:S1 family peptidase n=1 Tax=Amycolatopsis xylanica TaxID=589385 RepID=UPI001FE1F33F|nr:S1 family peptidase [Amycolatopsis xylanica]
MAVLAGAIFALPKRTPTAQSEVDFTGAGLLAAGMLLCGYPSLASVVSTASSSAVIVIAVTTSTGTLIRRVMPQQVPGRARRRAGHGAVRENRLQRLSRDPITRPIFDPDLKPVDLLGADMVVFCTNEIPLPSALEMSNERMAARIPPRKLFGRAFDLLIAAIAKETCFSTDRWGNSSATKSGFGYPVNDRSDPFIGEYVCDSGAYSGEVCPTRVAATDSFINGSDGGTGPGYMTENSSIDYHGSAGEGDSGGASFTVRGAAVIATGIIVAGYIDSQASCSPGAMEMPRL